MLSSIRAFFAALLWLCALVPPLLFLLHQSPPLRAVEVAGAAGNALLWALEIAAGLAVLLLILYPPFVASVRLELHRVKLRLTVPQGPILEAQARLRHFETAADHLLLARSYQSRGQPTRAAAHAQRAIELENENLAAHHQLGIALLQLGPLPTAIEHFAFIVERDAQHAFGQTLLLLGEALQRAGAAEQALPMLERHEAIFGENRRVLVARARAHLALGQRDLARAALRRAAAPAAHDRRLQPEEALFRARARAMLQWRRV